MESAQLVEAKIVVPQHVVHRTFVSETVVLNLNTGTYHGINVTGGRMLQLLQETGDFTETAKQLVDEYDRPAEEIEADLTAFCHELLNHGLIELK
jgi:Coenzyme PQQ synthesis protein D (PqqD)